MPMDVAIGVDGQATLIRHRIQLDAAMNRYTLAVLGTPRALTLDPKLWVLMEAEVTREP